jgi:tRNA threonylcarbamoyladenosine biosynthesis protein TsaE
LAQALSIVSHSEDETLALALKLSASFKPGDVVVLKGPLGAGKTAFVRGLATGMGMDESLVNSPSFTFVNEYSGEIPLFHFDLYRLSSPDDLYEIGWDDYLTRRGIVVVEWGERADELLPTRYYLLEFTILGENERGIDISLRGE